MKICKQCGMKYEDSENFCTNCGNKLEEFITDKKTNKRKWIIVLVVILLVGVVGFISYDNILSIIKGKEPDGNTCHTSLPENLLFAETDSEHWIANSKDAYDVITDVMDDYEITDLDISSEICKESSTKYSKNYSFSQTYMGIPVYGRCAIARTNTAGQVVEITNNLLEIKEFNTVEKIADSEAKDIVNRFYNNEVHISNPTKIIYSLYGMEPSLAWQLYVNGNGISETCIVDAMSGEIIETFSSILVDKGIYRDAYGEIQVETLKRDDRYFLIDEFRNIAIYDSGNKITNYALVDDANNAYYNNLDNGTWYDQNGNDVITIYEEWTEKWTVTDKDGYVLGKNAEIVSFTNDVNEPLQVLSSNTNEWDNGNAIRAMALTAKVYDFFKEVLERDGYDGSNGQVKIFVNDGWDNGNNAYSHMGEVGSPTFLTFGYDKVISADLVGHEYMHSVERTVSGMNYKNESGALMEALSDVFGELVEDWLDRKLNDSCDWIHENRNMISPVRDSVEYCYYLRNNMECPVYEKNGKHIRGTEITRPGLFKSGVCYVPIPYPDTYRGEFYWNGSDDNGGTHVNSTIISHACYLMTHPEDGSEGLTNEELAIILYETLGTLLPDCSFNQFATKVSYAAARIGLDEEKERYIKEAFTSVGLEIEEPLVVVIDEEEADSLEESDVTTELHEKYSYILECYISAFPWKNYDASPVIPSVPEASYLYMYNDKLSDIGYALIDVDGNGIEELLIGEVSDSASYRNAAVYDMYTLVNDNICHLLSSGERYMYMLHSDGYLVLNWSDSAAESGYDKYIINNECTDIVALESIAYSGFIAEDRGLTTEPFEYDDNAWFYSDGDFDYDNCISIPYAEVVEILEEYESGYRMIEYIPLSEFEKNFVTDESDSLSKDECYKLNLFLSNFSEQGFGENIDGKFESVNADPIDMINFASIYLKINNYDEIDFVTYNDYSYAKVSIEAINSVTQRFFGRSVTSEDIEPILLFEDYYNYFVIDEMLYFAWGDGETYNNMTVIKSVEGLSDGSMDVKFNVYSIDVNNYNLVVIGGGIIDKSVYYYTQNDAESHPDFQSCYEGRAVLKPYTDINGDKTYQLVSYTISSYSDNNVESEQLGIKYYADVYESLTLRDRASTSASAIAYLPPCTEMYVLEKTNGMAKVQVISTGQIGYVNLDYITSNPNDYIRVGRDPEEETGSFPDAMYYTDVNEYLTLRDKPSTSGNEITRLPDDTLVYLLKEENHTFSKVQVAETGEVGYVMTKYLKKYN